MSVEPITQYNLYSQFDFEFFFSRFFKIVVQRVKDLALKQMWCRSQLWLRYAPWPENFHMLWVQPKKKKINNVTVYTFAAHLMRLALIRSFHKLSKVELLGQRECTHYLLKASEMSNMVPRWRTYDQKKKYDTWFLHGR